MYAQIFKKNVFIENSYWSYEINTIADMLNS